MHQPNTEPKPFLINGQWVHNKNKTFKSINPATGETNYYISFAESEHVNAAIEAAYHASRSVKWRGLLPHQRANILNKMADLIDEKQKLFALTQMQENGKVITECMA